MMGALGVRMNAMIRLPNDELRARFPDYKTDNYGDHNLRVSTIKISIDGALGPHGAWLLEPYEDLPTSSGLNTAPVPDVEEAARIAAEFGLQLAVHAIGDRANQESLDIFEATFEEFPGNDDRRWRIEHSQHLHPDDIPRFGELGVIPSMQGIHCTSDAPYVLERLGEERAEEGAYVWQKLMATRVHHSQRHRRPGGGRERAGQLLRHGVPGAEGRFRVLPRSAHEPDGSAGVLHHQRGLRLLRGGHQGDPDAREAGRHHRAFEGHPHHSRRRRSPPPRWSTPSWVGR